MTRPLGDPAEHLNLVRHMSRATGVDLAAAAADGRLTQEEWAGMVTRCRTCQWVDGCKDWLSLLPEPGGAPEHPPVQCVNKGRLAQRAAD